MVFLNFILPECADNGEETLLVVSPTKAGCWGQQLQQILALPLCFYRSLHGPKQTQWNNAAAFSIVWDYSGWYWKCWGSSVFREDRLFKDSGLWSLKKDFLSTCKQWSYWRAGNSPASGYSQRFSKSLNQMTLVLTHSVLLQSMSNCSCFLKKSIMIFFSFLNGKAAELPSPFGPLTRFLAKTFPPSAHSQLTLKWASSTAHPTFPFN